MFFSNPVYSHPNAWHWKTFQWHASETNSFKHVVKIVYRHLTCNMERSNFYMERSAWLQLWNELTFGWSEVTKYEMTMGWNDRKPWWRYIPHTIWFVRATYHSLCANIDAFFFFNLKKKLKMFPSLSPSNRIQPVGIRLGYLIEAPPKTSCWFTILKLNSGVKKNLKGILASKNYYPVVSRCWISVRWSHSYFFVLSAFYFRQKVSFLNTKNLKNLERSRSNVMPHERWLSAKLPP